MSYKKNGISRVSVSVPRKFHSPILVNRDIPVVTKSGREIILDLFNKNKLNYILYENADGEIVEYYDNPLVEEFLRNLFFQVQK